MAGTAGPSEPTGQRPQPGCQTVFGGLNRWLVLLWRLGLGPWLNLGMPRWLGNYLVLGVRGRKSGKLRRVPLNYALDTGGGVLVVAGYGPRTQWYCNLLAGPEVELWLPRARLRARACPVTGPERLPALRRVLQHSGFAAWLFGGVNPYRSSDEELQTATAEYQVIRLQPGPAIKGPGGPGDLAWLWLVALLALLGQGLRGR